MGRAKKDTDKLTPNEERLDIYKSFRQNLRLLRAQRGLSAEAISKDIGFEKHYRIADLELGRAGGPKLEEVIKIANFYGVLIDDLLFQKAEVKFYKNESNST